MPRGAGNDPVGRFSADNWLTSGPEAAAPAGGFIGVSGAAWEGRDLRDTAAFLNEVSNRLLAFFWTAAIDCRFSF